MLTKVCESDQQNDDNNLIHALFRNFQTKFPEKNVNLVQNDHSFYPKIFNVFIENAPIGMFIIKNSKFTYINQRFSQFVEYSVEEIIHDENFLEHLIHPDDLTIVKENIQMKMENGKTEETYPRYRVRALKKNGEIVFVEINSMEVLFNEQTYIFGSVINVTDEVLANIEVVESTERFRSLFDLNPDAVFSTNLEGNILTTNESLAKLSGYSIEELQTISFTNLLKLEDLSIAMKQFSEATKGITGKGVFQITRKDGEQAIVGVTSFPMKVSGKIVGAYAIAKDITERIERSKVVEKLALYDSLTGLPNRRLFEERLQQAITFSNKQFCSLAVLFLDLDHFKLINDSLGHQVGDDLLRFVSNRLTHILGETDTISRFGGDEFIVLLTVTTIEQAIDFAEQILEVISKPFIIGDHSISTSTSIGIAFHSGQGNDSVTELIRKADKAMYETKKSGKNHYTLYHDKL